YRLCRRRFRRGDREPRHRPPLHLRPRHGAPRSPGDPLRRPARITSGPMRALAAALALAVAACSSPPPATPIATGDLVLPTAVPNGRVEVVVKHGYAVGETVRATIRLVPTSGTLRGPLDPFIQASGFHGTATVRHLAVAPITVN